MGDLATVARLGRFPTRGNHCGSVAANRWGEIGHPGGHGNARSQAQVIRPLPAQEERLNETGEDRGNDGRVENEENQTQVSHPFPRPLEIAARFPHSHRPGAAWESGKPKAGFPLSHLLFSCSKPIQKGDPCSGSLCSRLQAHCSMRKCSPHPTTKNSACRGRGTINLFLQARKGT